MVWARGWGVRDALTCAPVTPETAFQAASISKLLTAVLALQQVERGAIDLDADINRYLRRWQLPHNEQFPGSHVSLRQLLSHTAGTGVPGFSGYDPDQPRPTLIQILDGASPANTPPVRIERLPGSERAYSGGGIMIVQAALEDVTGLPFEELARRNIFVPLGMRRSSFVQPPLPKILTNVSAGHDQGNPFAAKYTILPEQAAAGLWTTPTDLAKLLIDLQAAATGRARHILRPATMKEMIQPVSGDWGLGPTLWGEGTNRRFGHYGGNYGFMSIMWSFAERGEGIVVMANGEAGTQLGEEIVRTVANDFGWSEFASRPLAEAIRSGPLFVRGTMNDWATTTKLTEERGGAYSTELPLHPGDYEFKIASNDWKTVDLGSEKGITDEVTKADLAPGGSNTPLKITMGGIYRFTLEANESGIATISVHLVGHLERQAPAQGRGD